MKEFPTTKTQTSQPTFTTSRRTCESTSRLTALRNSKCLQPPTLNLAPKHLHCRVPACLTATRENQSSPHHRRLLDPAFSKSHAQESIVTVPLATLQRFARCAALCTICTICTIAAPRRRRQHLAKINRHPSILCNLALAEPASLFAAIRFHEPSVRIFRVPACDLGVT
jgi:hypothetical protein